MKKIAFSLMTVSVLAAATLVLGQANMRMSTPGAADPMAAPKVDAKADLIAPAKAYFQLDEAIRIRFLSAADNAKGVKLIATYGLDAAKTDGVFDPNATWGDFKVFNYVDQKPLTMAKANVAPGVDGSVDVTALYPDLKKPGTYVLVWKNATPLVINYMYSPNSRPKDVPNAINAFKTKFARQLAAMPEAEREKVIAEVTGSMGKPTVIRVTPLESAVISTSAGEIRATFAYDVAPHTIDNFISLAKDKYYDGTTFHRVIKGFMIQGGDALGNTERAGTGGPGYEINAEFSDKPHVRGVLSMARSESPDSAGSQFFIIHDKADHLNGKYSAFGQVTSGLDAVDRIANTPSGEGGAVAGPRPKIESIRIMPATAEAYGIK